MKLKQLKWLGLALVTSLLLTACGQTNKQGASNIDDTKIIRVATSPGPYSELFLNEVKPVLEAQGYTIENRDFDDLQRVNVAIDEGSMDLNVEQHTLYMSNYNEEAGGNLVGLTPIPTVPTAIFGGTKDSLDQVQPGDIVAVSDDPADITRSMLLLEKAGWISLDPNVKPMDITENDIIENKAGVEFRFVKPAIIPRNLEDAAYGIIPGSTFYDSGMSSTDALLEEDMLPDLELQAVTRADEADSQWAKDLVAVYQSDDLKARIQEINAENDRVNWLWPTSLKNN
ncbi:hypothetical protein AWM75_03410 [Aerococcus urinaehominis]|uniref:Uncharacterized protein n=1 Tax=Aerococcus urinaehominis TaxID=128944 RepID=A0A0X8FKQ3_9LACT|nr:MetQ/NlpA family ABC transporter substrate-binding protein [Aerococcus urinaehominis]AMB99106.1 hypothetical protein AWM75_03410 [Aerococcus urinaehominis]SDM03891.1 D-methionine transport system substrate-binding protein [Aerococcus urinaehominis]